VRLVGKCVTVAADAAARQSERFLLKQLTTLLSALRSTAGAVILNSGDVALAVCAAPAPGSHHDADDEDDDAGTGAVDTLCFDARSRPLLRLRGASALKFTSVRGLQLHVLAASDCVVFREGRARRHREARLVHPSHPPSRCSPRRPGARRTSPCASGF
jgi:hypothetical protein